MNPAAARYGPTSGPPLPTGGAPIGSTESLAVSAIARARFSRPFPVWSAVPAGSALRAAWREGLVLGVLNAAVPFTLIAWGERYVDSGTAAVANASVPIWLAILALWFVPSERSTGLRALGSHGRQCLVPAVDRHYPPAARIREKTLRTCAMK